MIPALIFPVAVFSFLGGASFGRSRRGLSMLPPGKNALGVPVVAWRRFVAVMATSPKTCAGPRGRLGMFGLDARRLSDVGFMSDAKKIKTESGGAWTGTWVRPLDQNKFLSSAPAQYEAFQRSMSGLARVVAPHVGTIVDGRPATLSGLLGAGHLAGEVGIESWIRDPAVRKKFEATTRSFDKTNGIF